MISKPQGYDESQAYTGESVQLPAGCYVCEIKRAATAKSQSGRDQFVLLFDIAEGEHKGFYQKQYDLNRQQDANAKWKGVHKQTMDGTSTPFFKGLITSIEKSGNFKFPWGQENNEKALAGKKFGAAMGREQFRTRDGKKMFSTKVFSVRSVEGLKDAEIPEDKLLADDAPAGADPMPDANGFMNIPDGIDEELPFM